MTLIPLDPREHIDLLSLQQSQRFDDLDSGTKNIIKTILDSRTEIIDAVTPNQSMELSHVNGNAILSSYPELLQDMCDVQIAF